MAGKTNKHLQRTPLGKKKSHPKILKSKKKEESGFP